MVAALSYAVCVNFIPAYRIPADQIGDSNIGIADRPQDKGANLDNAYHVNTDLEKNQALEVESAAVKPDLA